MARISSDMDESVSPSTPPPCPLDPALDAALRDPVQRDQLNPMQIAEALPRLRDAGWESGHIGSVYSFSDKQVYQYGRLLKLPPAVQDQIRRNELGFSQAREVSRLLDRHSGAIEEAVGRIIHDKMNQRESGDYITSLITLKNAVSRPKGAEPAQPELNGSPKPKNIEFAKVPPESCHPREGGDPQTPTKMDSRFRGNDSVFNDGLLGEIEKSYLWEVLSSIPVLWRAIPWLRAQTQAAKGSVEKRRVFVGWVMAAAALWVFGPRIWSAVENFRHPKASNFSGPTPASGALPAPGAGKSEEVPIPQMARPVFGAAHLIELHWQDLGLAYRYHVYFYCGTSYDAAAMSQLNEPRPIHTPGALVDIPAAMCRDGGYLAVMAENSDHRMSDLSEPESFDGLNAANQDYLAEPLSPVSQNLQNGGEQQGRESRNGGNSVTAGKGGPITGNHSPTLRPSRPDSSPMANSTGSPYTPRVSGRPNGIPAVTGSSAAPPIPTNVHVVVESPDIIRISWRAVGPKITYNFYSCATSQMSPLRKENDRPINGNVIEWTPETGLDGYWIVVSAVDARGNESNYSEAVEVIRHPQQAPSAMRKALDKAADELQQRLP